jgi:hypothetical protein
MLFYALVKNEHDKTYVIRNFKNQAKKTLLTFSIGGAKDDEIWKFLSSLAIHDHFF